MDTVFSSFEVVLWYLLTVICPVNTVEMQKNHLQMWKKNIFRIDTCKCYKINLAHNFLHEKGQEEPRNRSVARQHNVNDALIMVAVFQKYSTTFFNFNNIKQFFHKIHFSFKSCFPHAPLNITKIKDFYVYFQLLTGHHTHKIMYIFVNKKDTTFKFSGITSDIS